MYAFSTLGDNVFAYLLSLLSEEETASREYFSQHKAVSFDGSLIP